MTRIAHLAALGTLAGLSLGLGGCVVAPPVDDAYYGPPPVAYAPPRPVVVSPPTVAVYPRPYVEERVVVRPSYRYDRDRHERWYHTSRDRRWNRDRDHEHDHDQDHDGR